jgi:type I restriction enzyme S subunit
VRYPVYSHYKDTGIEWLGSIPAHWKAVRNKELFYEVDERSETGEEELLTVSHLTGVTPRSEKNVNMFLAETLEDYKKCRKGDLIINTMWAWMGALGVSRCDGVVSPSYNVYRLRKCNTIDPFYLDNLYRIPEHISEIRRWSKGVWESRLRLYPESFFSMSSPVPPVEEQSAIAYFLRTETEKIDALIAKQQHLVRLLEEKRQAIISHSVTKGLNPNVPLKDSGVEWLGEIPQHWEVSKMKYLSRKIVDGTHHTPNYVDKGIPFLRVTDIANRTINLAEVKYISQEEHNELKKRCLPQRGDLLLSKNGTIGVPRLIDWDWEFSIFVSLCLIKLKPRLNARYSEYVFLSHQIAEQISDGSKQSTVTNLHLEKIAGFSFSVPPLDEQNEIIAFLDYETSKLDALIDKANRAIELLKEHRAALFSAAVTGKIDVRKFAAKGA